MHLTALCPWRLGPGLHSSARRTQHTDLEDLRSSPGPSHLLLFLQQLPTRGQNDLTPHPPTHPPPGLVPQVPA